MKFYLILILIIATALFAQSNYEVLLSRPDIFGLTGGTATDLDGISTTGLAEGTMVAVFDGTETRIYRLTTGTNAESSPGVIRPDDFADPGNAKVWIARMSSDPEETGYTPSGGGGGDDDWIISTAIGDGIDDTVLVSGGNWGLFRAGNVGFGNACSTHVNLGTACTTGTSGYNYSHATVGGGLNNNADNNYSTVSGGSTNNASASYATVGGGLDNHASGYISIVAGGEGNDLAGDYNTVGGGLMNATSGYYSTIGGGWENTATGDVSTIGGGYADSVSAVFGGVFSGYANKAGDESSDTAAVVCGGSHNAATAMFATVGGGYGNIASNITSTVGGGYMNTAYNFGATIGGGIQNVAGYQSTIGGGFQNSSRNSSTVAGGEGNTSDALNAAICGGRNNTVSGNYSFVGGGLANEVTGSNSVIPGGSSNTVNGSYSFAYGSGADVASTEPYSAVFNWGPYYDGTVFIETNAISTVYELYVEGDAYATVNWASSDLSLKEDIRDIGTGLGTVRQLRPVDFAWRQDGPHVSNDRSSGFIAQELKNVLPNLVSVADNNIGQLAVNYIGIIPYNTAAIQELDDKVNKLEKENEELRAVNKELITRIEALENK